jgi:hypothetical protein
MCDMEICVRVLEEEEDKATLHWRGAEGREKGRKGKGKRGGVRECERE